MDVAGHQGRHIPKAGVGQGGSWPTDIDRNLMNFRSMLNSMNSMEIRSISNEFRTIRSEFDQLDPNSIEMGPGQGQGPGPRLVRDTDFDRKSTIF